MSKDKLDLLFEMQIKLNNHVFAKQGIRNKDGDQLTMEGLFDEAEGQLDLTPNGDTNTWLGKYLEALIAESHEVKELLKWKFWSASKIDLPNIQEEIIDTLHFWISVALVAGMDSDTVFSRYLDKNQVNLNRQDTGYVARNG